MQDLIKLGLGRGLECNSIMQRIIVLLSVFIFFSCGENSQTNKLLIQKESFKNVLISIHRQDGSLKIFNLASKSIKVAREQYDSLYKANGVDEESLKYSYIYYTETEEIEKIYEEVLDSIGSLKSIHENIHRKESKHK